MIRLIIKYKGALKLYKGCKGVMVCWMRNYWRYNKGMLTMEVRVWKIYKGMHGMRVMDGYNGIYLL